MRVHSRWMSRVRSLAVPVSQPVFFYPSPTIFSLDFHVYFFSFACYTSHQYFTFLFFFISFLIIFFSLALLVEVGSLFLPIRQIDFGWLFACPPEGQKRESFEATSNVALPSPMMMTPENFTAPTHTHTHTSFMCVRVPRLRSIPSLPPTPLSLSAQHQPHPPPLSYA